MSWGILNFKHNKGFFFNDADEKYSKLREDLVLKKTEDAFTLNMKAFVEFFKDCGNVIFENNDDIPEKKEEPQGLNSLLHPDKNNFRGVWVWKKSQCGDIDEFIKTLKKLNCKRVYFKMYDAHSSPMLWEDVTSKEFISKFKENDIQFWGWGYTYRGSRFEEESQAVKIATENGMEGFVLDLEGQEEADDKTEKGIENVEKLLVLLKEVVHEGCLGYTSYGAVQYHFDKVPYTLLDKYCDIHFPQIYVEKFTFGNTNLSEIELCYKACMDKKLYKPIFPILSSEPDATNPIKKEELQSLMDIYPNACLYRVDPMERCLWNEIDYRCDWTAKKGVFDKPKANFKNIKVEDLQKVLISYGFLFCYPTGTYGNMTKEAVKKLEKWFGESFNCDYNTDGTLSQKCFEYFFEAIEEKEDKTFNDKIAELAEIEARKQLKWNSKESEAEKYLKPYRSLLGVPNSRFAWCGCFCAWVIKQLGYELPKIAYDDVTHASVWGWEMWAKNKGFWHNGTPKRGDLIIFDWSSNGVGVDHIGVVLSYENGKLICGEGNVDNMTNIKDRTQIYNTNQVKGFIRL